MIPFSHYLVVVLAVRSNLVSFFDVRSGTTSREIGSHQVEDVCDEIAEYGLKCKQLPMTGADILLFFRQALQDGVDAVQLGCNYSAAAIFFKLHGYFANIHMICNAIICPKSWPSCSFGDLDVIWIYLGS